MDSRIARVLPLMFGLLAGCTGPGNPSQLSETTLQKVRRSGELHVGYMICAPTVNPNPQNPERPTGFFVDMVEHIAENLKVKTVYHETTLKDFSAGLNTGQFDVSICILIERLAGQRPSPSRSRFSTWATVPWSGKAILAG